MISGVICCLVDVGGVFWFRFWNWQVLVLILFFEVQSGWLKNTFVSKNAIIILSSFEMIERLTLGL